MERVSARSSLLINCRAGLTVSLSVPQRIRLHPSFVSTPTSSVANLAGDTYFVLFGDLL